MRSTVVATLFGLLLVNPGQAQLRGGSVEGTRWSVVVKAEGGKAAGYRQPGGVATFLGIPYATPPLGQLRFRPPEPAPPWSPALLDATNFKPDCMQSAIGQSVEDKNRRQSEDCLYLNIWSPNTRPRRKLAVMVWIHGGAWQIGGSSRPEYNGAKLAAMGVVVVNFNYRLGAFGFLANPKDGLYGNYGLMDQRVVFHWVQRNIRAFGGDPRRVTIFGESAGAKSIGLHLLMPGQGELYHRAIMQSNSYGYLYRSQTIAAWLGEALKNSLDCEAGGLRCMQEAPAEEVIECMDALHGFPRSVGDFFTWGPVLTKVQHWGRTFKVMQSSGSGEGDLQQVAMAAGGGGGGGGGGVGGGGGGGGDSGGEAGRLLEGRGKGRGRGQVPSLPPPPSRQQRNIGTQNAWNVTVSQPLREMQHNPRFLTRVPVIVGTNAHEGHLFVYTIYPWPAPRWTYWAFVGLLFKFHASRVLKEYAALAEREAVRDPETGKAVDYRPALSAIMNDYIFRCPSWRAAQLLSLNRDRDLKQQRRRRRQRQRRRRGRGFRRGIRDEDEDEENDDEDNDEDELEGDDGDDDNDSDDDDDDDIDDDEAMVHQPEVYVYEFSHPTRTEGWPICKGKTCHTSEVPFMFNQISCIWANYSIHSPEPDDAAAATAENDASGGTAANRTDDSNADESGDGEDGEDGGDGGDGEGDSRGSDDTAECAAAEDAAGDTSSNTCGSAAGTITTISSTATDTTTLATTTIATASTTSVVEEGASAGDGATTPAAAEGEREGAEEQEPGQWWGGGGRRKAAAQRAARAAEREAELRAERALEEERLMRALRATTTMHDDATAVAGGRAGGLRSKGPSIDGWGPPRQYWRKLQQLLKVDADAIVARTSAARWASFAKTGDPNYEMYEKIWPIWSDGVEASLSGTASEGGDYRGHRRGDGNSKRGGRRGGRQHNQRESMSVYREATGGPEYLEIAHPPVVRHVGRDCYCEFWDSLEYRY